MINSNRILIYSNRGSQIILIYIESSRNRRVQWLGRQLDPQCNQGLPTAGKSIFIFHFLTTVPHPPASY